MLLSCAAPSLPVGRSVCLFTEDDDEEDEKDEEEDDSQTGALLYQRSSVFNKVVDQHRPSSCKHDELLNEPDSFITDTVKILTL